MECADRVGAPGCIGMPGESTRSIHSIMRKTDFKPMECSDHVAAPRCIGMPGESTPEPLISFGFRAIGCQFTPCPDSTF